MTEKKQWLSHDLRSIPAEKYRLPQDGRTWRHRVLMRQALAAFLATYASADGTSVYPSRATMAAYLSYSVRTVQNLLNDLDDLGFQKKVGLHGEGGAAVRQLNVDAFRGGAGVQSTEKQECKVQEQECNVEVSGVQSTNSRSANMHCTQPPVFDLQSKPPSNHHPTHASSQTELAGWDGWILLPTTTDVMGIPTDKEQQELKALARKEALGFDYLKKAVGKFRDRDQGFGGLTKVSPWRLFLQQAPTAIAVAKAELRSSGDWCMEHDPVYRAQQEASIARQTAEIEARWNAGPKRNEESIEDFLEESEGRK